MECDFSFVPFLVLTVDQFVGRGGSPLERQKEDSQIYRKTGTLPLHKRRSLRNCEKRVEFSTSDGCEDECKI